jgi:serine/threonine protein kinase
MSQTPTHPARKPRPSIVSEVIERGTNACIGILRDSPGWVLKWPHSNADALKSFECEKRALAHLGQNHYIVQLIAVLDEGLCFEYHPFRSIRHYYKQAQSSSLDQRYQWCHLSVSGFAYIHSKNIIHHDISARNILLSSNLDVKICDFGSAGQLGEDVHGLAEFRYSFGRVSLDWEKTFQYDLFCMGALFYEIILGRAPYDELNRAEVVERYKQQKFPSLDKIETGYATIINKCWRDHYSSIQELIAEFPPLPLARYGSRGDERVMF